jgi:hypothetical protein
MSSFAPLLALAMLGCTPHGASDASSAIRALRDRYAPRQEQCYDYIDQGGRSGRNCSVGVTNNSRDGLLGHTVADADSALLHFSRWWSGTPAEMRALADSLRQEIVAMHGQPRVCGTHEHLWAKHGWWLRVRALEQGPRIDRPTGHTWSAELEAHRTTRGSPPECIEELHARLDEPESWPVPGAGARLIPLDGRIARLERRVQGCYEIVVWRTSKSVGFTPPSVIRLDTVVTYHDEFYRFLRLRPKGNLFRAEWSVGLPDRVRLDWREPSDGPAIGGVSALLVRRGNTLIGTADRLRDYGGGDAGAEIVARRRPCASVGFSSPGSG